MNRRRRQSRPKSPKGELRNSQLMSNQEHPFQPQYSSKKGHENNIPYQSIKQKIPTVNQQVEMANRPQTASFHGAFPNDEIAYQQANNPQMPPLPLPNMIQNNATPMPMPMPPMYQNPQPPPVAYVQPAQPFPLAPNPMNAPVPMGMPPPLAPNPLNVPPAASLDPAMAAASQNFFQQLGGFNNFYYNALDPTLALKKNVPAAMPASKHWPVLAGTILLIAGIVVMLVGMGKFLQTPTALGVMGGGIVLYLALSIGCSVIRKYIFNLKQLADFQAIYDRMRKGRAYFVFSIECYHYKTTHTRKGGSRKTKVVTHTARTEYNPTHVDDDSGEVTEMKLFNSYAFIKYLKRFYFTDAGSEGRFIAAFNRFVSNNRRDTHQDYRYTFQIAGFEEQVGFSHTGEGQHSKVLFVIFTLLGLAYPYSLWIENCVSRYEIKLLKRLTT